ncbi:hypothetical protein H4R34_006331 [Dimargaris verticillata]|uniref:Uncharacterized protein n=1 Tax=Dimargaris verticillata TaxID=2761393 RepID=A0A9W8E8Y7_9FUNG|nr:hypothetical protein H4R34_006331 [Dimargaris verticillata]
MVHTGGKRKRATPKTRSVNQTEATSQSAANALTTHVLPDTAAPTESVLEMVPEPTSQPKGILRPSHSAQAKPRKKGKQFVTDTKVSSDYDE